jgi:hypothetical protein
MEKLARDKLSSLLRTLINYRRKRFYNIEPGRMFVGTHPNETAGLKRFKKCLEIKDYF